MLLPVEMHHRIAHRMHAQNPSIYAYQLSTEQAPAYSGRLVLTLPLSTRSHVIVSNVGQGQSLQRQPNKDGKFLGVRARKRNHVT